MTTQVAFRGTIALTNHSEESYHNPEFLRKDTLDKATLLISQMSDGEGESDGAERILQLCRPLRLGGGGESDAERALPRRLLTSKPPVNARPQVISDSKDVGMIQRRAVGLNDEAASTTKAWSLATSAFRLPTSFGAREPWPRRHLKY